MNSHFLLLYFLVLLHNKVHTTAKLLAQIGPTTSAIILKYGNSSYIEEPYWMLIGVSEFLWWVEHNFRGVKTAF